MSYTIHLEGYIGLDSDNNINLNKSYESLAEKIAGCLKEYEESEHQREDDECTRYSAYIPQAFVRMYFSNNELPLEEVQEKIILDTLGALDIYTEWYGYSEWTILGYNVINFTIGNHDLEEILTNYIGKYVHIVMEVMD